ncbi:MAG: dihydroorotase [Oscillospiraceae bacterium]|nr:dihydroorotase [Oscillospiraceae bacterium]
MQFLLSGGNVYVNGQFKKLDILVSNCVIIEMAPSITIPKNFNGRIIQCGCFFITPGFADLHVHLREPGFTHKATIKSETMSAAAGGYTTVCAMPNLKPVPDTLDNLKVQLDIIERDSVVRTIAYGSITMGQQGEELSDMQALAPFVCGFSDDGRGVQDEEKTREAMLKAKELGLPIVAHCEVNSLLKGGYIHDGEYARLHNMKGICSESEWKMIERDLNLVRQTGCRYHICHISAKESVELLRNAIKEGLSVSGETAPHYMALSDMDLIDEGRFKMNPPIRSEEDKAALIEGFRDGTISALATDHAPHSAEEKSKGLKDSLFGIVGLETAFTVVNTELVKTGKITLETLIDRISIWPRKFLNLDTEIKVGQKAEFTVINPDIEVKVKSKDFVSSGKATPFEDYEGFGRIEYTFYNGGIVWEQNTQKR